LTFRGTYEHSLDAKYRLTIPSRFRASLAGGVVLAVSPEIVEANAPRAVAIWTPAEYDEYSRSVLEGMNPAAPKARELKRFLNANSFETDLDSAHRVMIPEFLRSYAGLSKEVTVLGSGEYLEVLDRSAHTRSLQASLDRLPDLLASLGDTA
jgi:MraZ protein